MRQALASEILRDGVHTGRRVASREAHSIIDCERCGFKHALPLPDASTLERAYRENYYAEEKPNFLTHAGEDQEWFALSQIDKLEIFDRRLPPIAAGCWISAAARDFFSRPRSIAAGTPKALSHRARLRLMPAILARQ